MRKLRERMLGAVRTASFNRCMLEAEKAAEMEVRLAELIGVTVEDWRDYIHGNIRAGDARKTGYRFVRGTHGGTYRRDPEGTDILPAGYTIPTG
jgi:hypothetical protein